MGEGRGMQRRPSPLLPGISGFSEHHMGVLEAKWEVGGPGVHRGQKTLTPRGPH